MKDKNSKNLEKHSEKTNETLKQQSTSPSHPQGDPEKQEHPVAAPRRSISPETDEILQRIDSQHHSVLTKKSRNVVSNLLIVAGVALIVLPLVLTFINMRRNAQAMNAFLDETEWVVDHAQESVEDVDSFYLDEVDFDAVAQADASLDPSLDVIPPSAVDVAPLEMDPQTPDPALIPTPDGDPEPTKKPLMSKEEIQKRMIGVLFIDKIEVRIPIMTGVDDETLRVAAGRMPESGKLDQVGNVVLAGHRSYTFGKYFNRLDELEEGDTFYIKTGKKTLEYTIFKKFIVEPDDFSILNYNKTDKICTLFTCHPVVIANKRLVVQGVQTN